MDKFSYTSALTVVIIIVANWLFKNFYRKSKLARILVGVLLGCIYLLILVFDPKEGILWGILIIIYFGNELRALIISLFNSTLVIIKTIRKNKFIKMKKSRIFYLIIAVLVTVVIGYFIKVKDKSILNQQNYSIQSDKLSEVKTSEVNTKELEEYYQTYKNPFVIYLREVLNAYLNNDITKVNITTNALKKTSDENFIRGLEAFDKEYYKSKFVVLTFTEHKAKGVELRIMFQDKPDRIFDAWIYRFADGDFELRGFASDENYDPVKIKELNNTYKQFLLDKKHAI